MIRRAVEVLPLISSMYAERRTTCDGISPNKVAACCSTFLAFSTSFWRQYTLARLKSITARAPATLLGNWRTLGSDRAALCVVGRGRGEERRREEEGEGRR